MTKTTFINIWGKVNVKIDNHLLSTHKLDDYFKT